MTPVHRPVLVREVLGFLGADRGGFFVDATFGGGGHTRAILEAHAMNRVLAFDRDPESLAVATSALADFGARLEARHADYRTLPALLAEPDREAPDGILVDLGLSSLQLLDPERGFGFSRPGPLDMRFDRTAGPTAADLVNSLPAAELARLLRRFGEEPHARRIARALVARREEAPFATTTDLADAIAAVVPQRGPRRTHPATRTFQALRIAVNDELAGLDRFIRAAVRALRAGGRFVAIAFHSLEDRVVKTTLRDLTPHCTCPPALPLCVCGRPGLVRTLTSRAVRPAPAEVQSNSAARSARLRAAERLAA